MSIGFGIIVIIHFSSIYQLSLPFINRDLLFSTRIRFCVYIHIYMFGAARCVSKNLNNSHSQVFQYSHFKKQLLLIPIFSATTL